MTTIVAKSKRVKEGTYLQHGNNPGQLEESKWMLHRLPTLPGLPSVGLPPDALPLVAQPTTFTKTITSRGASYQKTLCPKAEEVSPRQVSDQTLWWRRRHLNSSAGSHN